MLPTFHANIIKKKICKKISKSCFWTNKAKSHMYELLAQSIQFGLSKISLLIHVLMCVLLFFSYYSVFTLKPLNAV